MTFGAHNLVLSEPFLDYLYEIWHLLSALYSDTRKTFLYRCTSTFSSLNYWGGIFLISQLSIRSGAHKLFHRFFGVFEIFDRNFAKIMAPPGGGNGNYVAIKSDPLWEEKLKPHWKRPINRDAILVRAMHPSNAHRCGLGAWQTKIETYKHHIFFT